MAGDGTKGVVTGDLAALRAAYQVVIEAEEVAAVVGVGGDGAGGRVADLMVWR